MRRVTFFLVFVVILQSCQLIVIESKEVKKHKIIANRQSPLGVLNLFLMQLDSNDLYTATFFKTDESGRKLLPLEQYEMLYSTYRLSRQISQLPITKMKIDTIHENTMLIKVEFDYIRQVDFLTSKIDSVWYIAELSSKKVSLY